jgi:hypothetical protein
MRSSYFDDYSCYAIDSLGDRHEMIENFIWLREAKVCKDYCAIGNDFISSDIDMFPVVEMNFLPGTYKVKLLLHHLYSEFKGSTSFSVKENDIELLDGIVGQGEIHEYVMLVKRDVPFSLQFTIHNKDIEYGILRYMIEDDIYDSNVFDDFSVEKKISYWKLNKPTHIQREVKIIEHDTNYKY